MSVLAHDKRAEYIGEVKPPALQGNCALEIGVAVHVACKPILFLSVHLFSVVQFFTKDVNLVPFSASNVGTSQATNFVAIVVPISVLFLIFNADSRAEGVEFQTILSASRLSDIFFNASFCRIGRFRFGCLKR